MMNNGKGEGIDAWAKGFEVGAAGGVLMRSEAEAQGLDVVDYIAGHKAGAWERQQKEVASQRRLSPEVPPSTGNQYWIDSHKQGYKLAMAGEFIAFHDQIGWHVPAFEAGYKKGREDRVARSGLGEPDNRTDLRKRLEQIHSRDIPCGAKSCSVLVVAVRMPEGNIETITNHGHDQIARKLAYYVDKYDHEMKLTANTNIEIIDFMLV